MVDLAALQTFIAVIDCGSIIGAARARGYSPAAVSRQMSALQARVGVRFFEPDGRGIRATSAAEEFAERARILVDEISLFECYSKAFGRRVARGVEVGSRTRGAS
jgi:DNA-binding transcriptional LysR family regulator